MIRFAEIEPYWPKVMTVCGAVAGGAGAALSVIGEFAMQVLGVPLPVVMASAAGAGLARSFMDAVGFLRALCITAIWTVIGCTGAPLAQALLKGAAAIAGVSLDLPTNTLAGVGAALASIPWWGPKVWPFVAAKLGIKTGGSNA